MEGDGKGGEDFGRLGTLVTVGGNANGAEAATGGAGEIGGAGGFVEEGEIGGAMGGIDVESEVFCDTLEPQRIDRPRNRRKIRQ